MVYLLTNLQRRLNKHLSLFYPVPFYPPFLFLTVHVLRSVTLVLEQAHVFPWCPSMEYTLFLPLHHYLMKTSVAVTYWFQIRSSIKILTYAPRLSVNPMCGGSFDLTIPIKFSIIYPI